jgi:beta-glucanase (GH16 family)
MKRTYTIILLAISFAYIACTSKEPEIPKIDPNVIGGPPVVENYGFETTPVWQDEFDYTGEPDQKKWGYDLGGNGWGNNEKQNYTNSRDNSRVAEGKLTSEARYENNAYTSARLVTKKKADFTYGRFVIKAKIPQGIGSWPAIWMLATDQNYGTNYWPDNGEIDIMEHVGFDPKIVHANIHTKAFNHSIGTNKGNKTSVMDPFGQFHEYICEWTPNEIKFFIDAEPLFTFPKSAGAGFEQWPFNKPFHLLLNIAVGGNWGGQKGIDDKIFPIKMEVDYVRVYAVKKL